MGAVTNEIFERRMMSKINFLSVLMLGFCVVVGCGEGESVTPADTDAGHDDGGPAGHDGESGSGTGGGMADLAGGLEAAAGDAADDAAGAVDGAVETVKETAAGEGGEKAADAPKEAAGAE